MADHSLDRQIGIDRLADDIRTLRNQVSELRTLQRQGNDAINVLSASSTTFNFSLPMNTAQTVYFVLASLTNKNVIALPLEFTLYEGAIAVGNEIGHGNARDGDYAWYYWRDKVYSDGYNVADAIKVIHYGTGPVTVWVSTKFRFLVGLG